jgi:hypothetical protein
MTTKIDASTTSGLITNADNSGILELQSGGVTRTTVDSNGTRVNSGSLGYGVGTGGTVTQLTSKTTAVTINKATGRITTSNSALAAGARTAFTVNNSLCGTGDTPVVAIVASTNYLVQTYFTANGNFGIAIENITGDLLSEAININFAIIKGATS